VQCQQKPFRRFRLVPHIKGDQFKLIRILGFLALIIRNQKSDDCVLGLALGGRDTLRVSVQRQPRGGKPKQILLNLYVSSKGPKQT
jgi:hypothetical protein